MCSEVVASASRFEFRLRSESKILSPVYEILLSQIVMTALRGRMALAEEENTDWISHDEAENTNVVALVGGESTARTHLYIWNVVVLLPILISSLAYAVIPFWSSIYPPLDASTDSLRLLILQPGNDRDSIICSLESTTFHRQPRL